MNFELLKEFIDCAGRELKLRRNVYPRLISQGKMSQETADKEIKLMAGIKAAFEKIYNGNAPEVQKALFDVGAYQQKNSFGNNNYY